MTLVLACQVVFTGHHSDHSLESLQAEWKEEALKESWAG